MPLLSSRSLPQPARLWIAIIAIILTITTAFVAWRIILSSAESEEQAQFMTNCPNGVVILYLADGDPAYTDASNTQTIIEIIGKDKVAIMQACRDNAYWVVVGKSILFARLGTSLYEGPHAADRTLTSK